MNRSQAIEAALRDCIGALVAEAACADGDDHPTIKANRRLVARAKKALALPEREPPHCASCSCGLVTYAVYGEGRVDPKRQRELREDLDRVVLRSECPDCAEMAKQRDHYRADRDREKARADAAEAECARLREDNNSLRRFQDEAIRRCARDRCSMRARRIAELESEVEGLEKERDRERARADALQKIVDGCPEPSRASHSIHEVEATRYYFDHILPAKRREGGSEQTA